MRSKGLFALVVLTCLIVGPAITLAADSEQEIARIIQFDVMPGMDKEFESGVKKHMDWHRKQNDPWAWLVWETISGENVGTMGAGTFGHSWADYDNSPVSHEDDMAEAEKSVLPFIETESVKYYSALTNVSNSLDSPSPMSEIIHFHVHPAKAADFAYCVKKFHDAIVKTKWGLHYTWYELVNGGEVPHYVLALPRENWAAFAPPEKPFLAVIEEAYGRQEATALLEQLTAAIRRQSSEIVKFREELSYVPEE